MSRQSRRIFMIGAGAVALGGAALVGQRLAGGHAYRQAVARVWSPPDPAPGRTAEVTRALVHHATLAASGHNTQPWLFAAGPAGIRILPDPARRTPVVDPDDHHLFASLGCAAENLALAAPRFGLAAEVQPLPEGVFVALTPSAAPLAEPALFAAIPRRQCVRLDYDGQPLTAEDWTAILRAGRVPGVDVALLTGPEDLRRLTELVVAGNSAQFRDPAFLRELKAWVRFDAAEAARSLDGLFAGASGNPTLPPWLGRRIFERVVTAEGESAKVRSQLESSAGVAVVLAERDAPDGWVRAGRAVQRMMLAATARDLRCAFVNQPTEALGVRPDLMAFLGTDRRPNLLLRFGRGPQAPRSLRRPPEAVLRS